MDLPAGLGRHFVTQATECRQEFLKQCLPGAFLNRVYEIQIRDEPFRHALVDSGEVVEQDQQNLGECVPFVSQLDDFPFHLFFRQSNILAAG